ncbi:MAG: hypothetical protein RMX26_05305 [Planktomarina sp.]|nr:hypothetical protein [Planktomarina sp.]
MSIRHLVSLLVVLSLSPPLLSLAAAEKYLGNKSVGKLYDQATTGNVSGGSASWAPQIEGKTRYHFKIPLEGLKTAKKYQDAGPLYYLSTTHDLGLKFLDVDFLSIEVSPKSLDFDWSRTSIPQGSRYSVGLEHIDVATEAARTTLSLGYTKILDQKVLASGLLEADPTSGLEGSFGVTFLNQAEKIQYAGWLKKTLAKNSYYEIAMQSLAFEALGPLDTSVILSQSSAGFSISAALQKDIGPAKPSLGLTWSEQSQSLEAFWGVSFSQTTKNGNVLKLRAATASSVTKPSWLDDLKPLRRAELMGHWVTGMRFFSSK